VCSRDRVDPAFPAEERSSVVQAHPPIGRILGPIGRVLPRLLTPERREVEQVEHDHERFLAPPVHRPGVEHALAVAEEDADGVGFLIVDREISYR